MELSRRISAGAALFIALGCAASSGAPANRGRTETVTIDVPGAASSRLVLRDDPSGSSVVVAVPAARAWTAVPAAYNALPIPIVALDTTSRSIRGVASAYRQFLRNPVSRFVDCGTTLVGPNADTYRVELRISSQVVPVSDTSSSIHTRVEASGTGSVGAVNCSTTGSLERLVNTQVVELLGTTP